MSNLDKIKKDASSLSEKVKESIKVLLTTYSQFQISLEEKFREEVREQGGKMEGLEDFYRLNMLVKRNSQIISNALGMINKVKDVSGFDIEEITDTVENNKIKELVS
jgi:hypothetical protein